MCRQCKEGAQFLQKPPNRLYCRSASLWKVEGFFCPAGGGTQGYGHVGNAGTGGGGLVLVLILPQASPGAWTHGFLSLGLSPLYQSLWPSAGHWIITCRIVEDLYKHRGGLQSWGLRWGKWGVCDHAASEQHPSSRTSSEGYFQGKLFSFGVYSSREPRTRLQPTSHRDLTPVSRSSHTLGISTVHRGPLAMPSVWKVNLFPSSRQTPQWPRLKRVPLPCPCTLP